MLLNTRQIGFLNILRDEEHLFYGQTLRDEIRDDVLSVSELVPVWNAYEPVLHHEGLLFQVSKASIETATIAKEDRLRDVTFREVRRLLKYYSKMGSSPAKEAADSLLFLMHTYDAADHRNIFGETAYIRGLVADFGRPEHAAMVDTVPGLRELLAILASANEKLDLLYNQRLHAREELEALGKRVNVRKDADRALVRLLGAINTVYEYNELKAQSQALRDVLQRIAMRINGLGDKLRLIMAQRQGRRRKKIEREKEKPASPTPPPSPEGDAKK
ncbi:MAG: DUF6261 family protein [Tannerellaceae bacterium]|jgi:hypothetical protein|nr:DUF6261 family protein [Tannerellaceae bacterium]